MEYEELRQIMKSQRPTTIKALYVNNSGKSLGMREIFISKHLTCLVEPIEIKENGSRVLQLVELLPPDYPINEGA